MVLFDNLNQLRGAYYSRQVLHNSPPLILFPQITSTTTTKITLSSTHLLAAQAMVSKPTVKEKTTACRP